MDPTGLLVFIFLVWAFCFLSEAMVPSEALWSNPVLYIIWFAFLMARASSKGSLPAECAIPKNLKHFKKPKGGIGTMSRTQGPTQWQNRRASKNCTNAHLSSKSRWTGVIVCKRSEDLFVHIWYKYIFETGINFWARIISGSRSTSSA